MLCQMAVGPQFQIFMSSCCFFTWPSDNFGSYPKMSSVQFRKTLFCSQLQQSKTYCTYKFFFLPLNMTTTFLQYSSKWLLSIFFFYSNHPQCHCTMHRALPFRATKQYEVSQHFLTYTIHMFTHVSIKKDISRHWLHISFWN